jgi:uncharacterized protein YggE
MKNILLLPLLLILALGCKPQMTIEMAQEKQADTVKKDALMVQGTTKITIAPDRVDLTFGLFQETKQLKDAVNKTKEIMNNILTYAAKAGIPESDIKVQNISMNRHTRNIYKYDNKGKRIFEREEAYYRLDQSFTLTLTDIAHYSKIFNDILELGVNKITNINFYSTQIEKVKDDALVKAIEEAKNKANIIAETSGLKINKLINVVEFEGDRSRFVTAPTITRSADADAYFSPVRYSAIRPRAASEEDEDFTKVETIVPVTPAGTIDVYGKATLIYELK